MHSLLVRSAAAAALLSIATPNHAEPITDKPIHFSGTIVTPDQQPARDASAILIVATGTPGKRSLTQSVKVDKNGAYDLVIPPPIAKLLGAGKTFFIAYAKSPHGIRVGLTDHKTTVLEPFTHVRLRLMDEDGKPAAYVRISPNFFTRGNNFGVWSPVAGSQWSAVTDAQGYAVFSGLPQGDTVRFFVDDARFAFDASDRGVTLASKAQTPDQTITLQYGGSLTGRLHFDGSGSAAAGALVMASGLNVSGSGLATTDAQGRYTIPRLLPGVYRVEIETDAPFERRFMSAADRARWEQWTAAAPSPVTVTRGKATAGVDLTLVHGALIVGHVTDKTSGKPIAQASLQVYGPAHPMADRSVRVETGPDGAYSIRVPAGLQSVTVFGGDGAHQSSVQVADGETKTADFQVSGLQSSIAIQGVVLGPDGAPVPGAEVYLQGAPVADPTVKTDSQGKFSWESISISDAPLLYARHGTQATPTATPSPTDGSPVTLRLAPDSLCVFQGQVTDHSSAPIAHAKITLIRWAKNGFGEYTGVTSTDAGGRYVFPPNYGGADYAVQAEADGYAISESEKTPAIVGKTLDIPAIALTKADSFTGGVVLDSQGKPIAGAEVQDADVPKKKAVTGKDGRFHFTGVPGKSTCVRIDAPGGRQAAIQIASGQDDNEITVKSEAENTQSGKHLGDMMEADPDRHGDGTDAHVLLAAAQAKAAPGGKSVLLIFHASWCGACVLLDYFFKDPKIQPIIDSHFVVQSLDISEHGDKKGWENPGSRDINKQYDGANTMPFCIVLDAAGKKLGDSKRNGENIGMPSQSGDIQCFLDMLKHAQPSLTAAEIATLRAGLKQHSTY